MIKYVVVVGVLVIPLVQPLNAWPVTAPMLLDMCAGNLDMIQSWRLTCESLSETASSDNRAEKTLVSCDFRFDGTRVCSRIYTWPDANTTKNPANPDKAHYMSLQWDGRTYTKYYRSAGGTETQAIMDDFATTNPDTKEFEVKSLQYNHPVSFLIGHCPGTFERIDVILRSVHEVSLHAETEEVNGTDCYVIDAETDRGRYTVWIDPNHSFSIAKRRIEMNPARGHLWHGRSLPFGSYTETVEITKFRRFGDVWLGVEAVQCLDYEMRGTTYKSRLQVHVTSFSPNPDHEVLRSFASDDIPDGTHVIVAPITHIQYLWHAGSKLTLHFDEDVIAGIDKTLAELKGEGGGNQAVAVEEGRDNSAGGMEQDPNTEAVGAAKDEPASLKPRPHCGLYCLYSILKLSGQNVDFRDLVKPEYYGRLMGSSLAELNRGAADYGLHAGVVSRLSTRALRDCPYWAILHVRRNPEAKEYDHYQLFLGAENGKAKLFNPPEGVKLVKLSELAPLWDGYALFVSQRPFNVDAIFTADRQRLLLYAMIGGLILLAAHLGRRIWLAITGNLPRRWTVGLTAGQAGLLTLSAVFCGGFYHFANDEGFLANAGATASLQKAYQGAFIPRISHTKARELLGTDTVFIDARLTGDYERGHLEGAISVPVDANDALRQETTSAIPKNSRIVLYCQSAGCKFAERVGVKLLDEGFTNLTIFKGGWMEWTEKYGTPDPNQSERKDEQSKD